MQLFNGQCHCTNLRYQLTWPNHDRIIPVRRCSCSFCTKFNGSYVSHPDAKLQIFIANSTEIKRYCFGTKTADFYICMHCGVVPLAISCIQQHDYAVVNINTLVEIDRGRLQCDISNFDDESIEQRLRRRTQKWIPNITIEHKAQD